MPFERIKKESRKHPRISVYLYETSASRPLIAEHAICSYNLSIQGMMLIITPPVADFEPLRQAGSITAAFVINPKSGQIKTKVQIAWIKEQVLTPENENASCIGINFCNPSIETKACINHFLRGSQEESSKKKVTCRDCAHFQESANSKYAFCTLHRMTVLNSEADPTLSFNQIYSYPCKELKPKA